MNNDFLEALKLCHETEMELLINEYEKHKDEIPPLKPLDIDIIEKIKSGG